MTTLLLARHGETDWNREGRWQGWADPPLNETGRAQARELAAQLRDTPFDAVYSSDLRRAHETALILAAPHGVPVVVDRDLREIDVGSWSGLTRAEIAERFPDGKRPDGETHEQHAARILAAVTRIARAAPGSRVLVVGHGGTIRSIHDVISDLPYHPVPNCHVLEVHFRDDRLVAPPLSGSAVAGVAPSELVAIPLFASLSEAELADVAGRLAVKELGPGVRLAGEGATGPALFLLQAGEASVTVGGEEIATLGPGDFLGEIALLGGGRRTATVTTTSAARVLVLFRDDVHELVASFPDVGARIEAAMQERLGRSPASER